MPGISKALDGMSETFVSNTTVSRDVSRAVKAGKLRKLASRLYTRNLTDPPEVVVRRDLWHIVAGYFPGALIADRTALENAPASNGSVFLVTESGTSDCPGTPCARGGESPPLFPNRPFIAGLFLSSTARAYLENMRPSRTFSRWSPAPDPAPSRDRGPDRHADPPHGR